MSSQRVVRAIEAASFVMGELAKEREDINKELLHAAVSGFLEQIQVRSRGILAMCRRSAGDLCLCTVLMMLRGHTHADTPTMYMQAAYPSVTGAATACASAF